VKVYKDADADLNYLAEKVIAVIGYGNQGRAQALNMKDNGLDVIVGNQDDTYAERAWDDGLTVKTINDAARAGDIVFLLIPDEVMPAVFVQDIEPSLKGGDALVFASGYNVAFGLVDLPRIVDVLLLAPRMIGAGVRDRFLDGRGFPSFFAVEQDYSESARDTVLALAKGIGSTRFGAVEVTFSQEAELDLFTEQCFGPAFGNVLTTAVDLLIDQGYPPEAVLLELYMSGEFSYTMGKIAEMGMIEQSALHSRTSQYGTLSRGMRFVNPGLRDQMKEGLEEIRSGSFTSEWTAEQASGGETIESLIDAARSLPIYSFERELLALLGGSEGQHIEIGSGKSYQKIHSEDSRFGTDAERISVQTLLERFIEDFKSDPAMAEFSTGRKVTLHYVLKDEGLEFFMRFDDGQLEGALGGPPEPAQVRLEMDKDVMDGLFSGSLNAARAAMTGKIKFKGDARQALSIQSIQADIQRLYNHAKVETGSSE
jgi:ketol-acid reductoisomerase